MTEPAPVSAGIEKAMLDSLAISPESDSETQKLFEFLSTNKATIPPADFVMLFERLKTLERKKLEDERLVQIKTAPRTSSLITRPEDGALPVVHKSLLFFSKVFVTRFDKKSSQVYLMPFPGNKVVRRKLSDLAWLRKKLMVEFPLCYVS